ncbi:MAG: aldo/keto reductase [Candidatus Zipacnadales bacterium]
MQYREFGKTGIQLSALGWGLMRLPQDDEEAIRVIRHGIDLGINYLDTAPGYNNGWSERMLGEAIKGYDRSQLYLSTKNPLHCNTGKGWRERLEASLERIGVDYIDFYQVGHSMSWEAFENNFSQPGAGMEEAKRALEEGLIRHICLSCHDSPQNMLKLLQTGFFEGMTLQYNLLDRTNEPVIDYARENGLGIVVMGPVGGGRLGFPSERIQSMIPGGTASTPEIALRFVLANPGVTTAISGMNTIEMVEENVATASRQEPLTEEEKSTIAQALEENRKLAELYCTGCNYCMPCPNNVGIPECFRLMNLHRVWGLTELAKQGYRRLGPDHREGWLPASACVECGQCEEKCPQNIPIIEQLKETAAALGEAD